MCARLSPNALAQAVFAQLRRLDGAVCERARRLQAQRSGDSEYRGLFVSDEEFSSLLKRPLGLSPLDGPQPHGPPLPPDDGIWAQFLAQFRLTPLEGEILLLALLAEADLKYERICAYLQDDVTARHPTVDLALNLLCTSLPERLQARRLFAPDAPLLRYRLLSLHAREGHEAFIARTIHVEPRLASQLLEGSWEVSPWPPGLEPLFTLDGDWPALPEDFQKTLDRLAQVDPPSGLWVHLAGQDRWLLEQSAAQLGRAWGRPCLLLRLEALEPLPDAWADAMGAAVREALLRESALAISPPQHEEPPGSSLLMPLMAPAFEALTGFFYPVLWLGWAEKDLPLPSPGSRLVRLQCPPLDYTQRHHLWQRATSGQAVEEGALLTIAGRFRLSGVQIMRAARLARAAAWQRAPASPQITFDDLARAARSVSAGHLGSLARRIEPRRSWEDLVLPPDRLAQLREMCNQFTYSPLVLDTWGFGKHSARGLSALFAGPSGTGKTMAAEVIAHALALDLYQIDLSGVVSKYIGETEKNLERIFEMARDSNAILLFDEADALFGKRSETHDAHDRYANIEVSYLLQKIEEYDGIVILTSNLRQNLDEAFLRRLQFSIEFPMPDEEARLAIWQRLLPEAAPLHPSVDLADMARRFKFSGGSIRNVLVNAAFLAAHDGQVIRTEHLLWAARREFQKLGRLVDESQFSPARPLGGVPLGKGG